MHQSSTALTPRRRLAWLAALAITAIILPAVWYLGSPLFINQMVSERLPAGPPQAATAQPAVLALGQFGAIDAVHRGEGRVSLLTLPDGSRLLRFDDFKVTNGPDLFVYLSSHPAPRDGSQLHAGAALEVARLKGNIGSQNYELPPGLDLSAFRSVIIYCRQFSVVFSTATLTPSA